MGCIITSTTVEGRTAIVLLRTLVTYLCCAAVVIQAKPKPLLASGGGSAATAAAAAQEDSASSWWTTDETELEPALGRNRNTLESISRNWQKYEPDALKRVFLRNATVTCNDGSRSGYYLRRHSGSKIWLMMLEGGWYCYDDVSCASRWSHTRSLMTSKAWPLHHQATGIMSGDPDENPVFWRANIIYVPYCSSDVWTGTSQRGNGQKYAFMGSLILQEIIKELLPKGLLKARKLLLAGSSAGATGVLLNVDSLSDLLRSSGSKAKVRGLVDSGWFLDSKPFSTTACVDPRHCSPAVTLKKGVELWKSQIPSQCGDFYREDASSCFYGSKLYAFLKTPVFIFQWLYDEAQMMASNVFVPRTKAQGAYVQSMRDDMVRSLENVSAVFAPSCVGHIVLTEKRWAAYSIGQVTFGQALQCWWDGSNEANNAEQSSSPYPNSLNDNNLMLSDQAVPQCDRAKLRRCRRRQKRQRKLNVKLGGLTGRKQCRCRRSSNVPNHQRRSRATSTLASNQVTGRSRRFTGQIHFHHTWQHHPDLCNHHLIDDCRLPNCSAQCPKNYDTFSGKPIDFEQMLRNAGVRSRNPIKDIFL
ncbi:Palmitoleoyl-protein carboxylesterase notum1 [Hypsibius exemplaris]|uniref:Palmitoleoyl-protein carboxylesterase notum1 n=1 Tax=Hypsibius exemplaris TaxID=2072580 RepID=A0A1W0X9S9_HYPEX|nr:Palmitoleoyl-protein carboxylesterase notum1 [Hypsibius exemplaris]